MAWPVRFGSMIKLTLTAVQGRLAICRLAARDAVPGWASSGTFSSITRTAEELSIVCQEEAVPRGVKADAGWLALRVAGPFDFSQVGVLAALAVPLAGAGIPILAISTFDTDYLLVKAAALQRAAEVLSAAGQTVLP